MAPIGVEGHQQPVAMVNAMTNRSSQRRTQPELFGAVQASYTVQVGRTRHYIGIILLCANFLTTYAIAAYAWVVFDSITAESPFPEILGLSLDQQDAMVLWLFLAGEISFLLAIYVLGADWWGKFRNIFVWNESDNLGGETQIGN